VVVGAAELLVQVFDHLLQGGRDADFLVVCRDHDAHLDLCRFDGGLIGDGEAGGDGRVFLLEAALGMPAVVPAGEWLGGVDGAIGLGCKVCLLGGVRESRFGGEEVEADVDLRERRLASGPQGAHMDNSYTEDGQACKREDGCEEEVHGPLPGGFAQEPDQLLQRPN
jgi:hypothetical protein